MDKTVTQWLKTDIGPGNDSSPTLAYLMYDSSETQSINSALDKFSAE